MRRLPFILIFAITFVIAATTVVEKAYGTPYVSQKIYGAWWFVVLWGMMAVAGCWLLWKKKMWRRPSVFSLHLSFVIILLGALVTHLTSHRGFVQLREGEATRFYLQRSEDGCTLDMKPMPFYLALDSFHIKLDEDGKNHKDYVSYVQISDNDEKVKNVISMNKIARSHGYRIYQTSFDDDWRGSLFTVSYDPWGTGITYAGYLLLAISMIWNGSSRRKRDEDDRQETHGVSQKNEQGKRLFTDLQIKSLLFWIIGILLASYMVIAIAFRPLMPVLRSPLLFIHVGVIMISYILLFVSLIKRVVLRYAVFLLTAGIFLGAIWANISWGSYWSWDPKESWALITLIVYSIPLHNESFPWFRSDKNYRIYGIFCLLCLLMTYFGVNFFLGGMHSYLS